ncbi:unnamed protein product [Rotaria sp. Silwood1]|nr:unnamed protein product [Rotaria sp. Silwood1]CAF4846958.1 unnamed protein product [Rotaria sp. Silwood1]
MNNSFIVDYGGNTDGDDDLPPSVTEVDSDSNSMAQMKDFNKTIHELYEQFSCLLKRKKLANQLNDPVSVQELIIEAERLSIVEKAPFYIAKCLFTDQIVKEIGVYRMLLYPFCTKNTARQRSLLDGIEAIINENEEVQEKLLNTEGISRMFYELYQKDIVSEEVFYHWYEQESTKLIDGSVATKIRNCAKKFIEWLRTAEEGSDQDDDRS